VKKTLKIYSVYYVFSNTEHTCVCVVQWRRNEFESGGGRWKIYCCASPLFGSKSAISRFGECFCDGQYSYDSFLFAVLLLTVPAVPSHL